MAFQHFSALTTQGPARLKPLKCLVENVSQGSIRLLGAALLAGSASSLLAAEGGTSAYLMGSRDSFSGIVPPAGTYVGLDAITFSGDIDGLSIGGLPIDSNADVTVNLLKLSITHVFEQALWGGRAAINLNIPFLDAELDFIASQPASLAGQSISDTTSGLGDITITPFVGWSSGNLHYSAGFSIFAPVGDYSTASADIAGRDIDVLSNGKNVWSAQPVFSLTHFDPTTGREFSGATSLLFSEKNSATDYQTGTAFTFEGAAMQHFKSGWAAGLLGYYYQQLEDDSGSGAAGTRAALGANSLKARATGLGPLVSYSGTFLGRPTTFKFKYINEFNVKRRFESDVFWFNATMSF